MIRFNPLLSSPPPLLHLLPSWFSEIYLLVFSLLSSSFSVFPSWFFFVVFVSWSHVIHFFMLYSTCQLWLILYKGSMLLLTSVSPGPHTKYVLEAYFSNQVLDAVFELILLSFSQFYHSFIFLSNYFASQFQRHVKYNWA